MPAPDRIAALTATAIADATKAYLASGDARAWQRAMEDAIAKGHAAAAIAGTAERLGTQAGGKLLNERNLSRAERQAIKERVAAQMPYLRQFAQDAPGLSDAQVAARAALYAGATRATYSEGRWYGKGLPFHPADGGTECLVQCKCSWVERSGQMYWELGAAEHCPDCLSREAQASPWRA